MALTSQITTSLLQVDGRMTEGGVIEIVPGARLLLDVGVENVEPGALLDEIATAVAEAQAARDEAVDISGISTSDELFANRIETPGTATQTALSATIAAERGRAITPEKFGAVGNGSTNDGPALQSAFDLSALTGLPVVLDSEKTYGTAVQLNLSTTAPTRIEGRNATIKALSPMTAIIAKAAETGAHISDIRIVDLNLDGDLKATRLIAVERAHRMYIDGGIWKNATQRVLALGEAGGQVYECEIRRMRIVGIDENKSGATPAQMPAYGMTTGSATTDNLFDHIEFKNCGAYIRDTGNANLYQGCHGFGYPFATVPGGTPDYVGSVGFELAGFGARMIGCYPDTTKVGVRVSGEGNMISGCIFMWVSQWKPAAPVIGVDVTSTATRTIIVGNHFTIRPSATFTGEAAVKTAAGSFSTQMVGNMIHGAFTVPYVLSSTGDTDTVMSNMWSEGQVLDIRPQSSRFRQLNLSHAAGQARDMRFQTAAVDRWTVRTRSTAESGSNAGSDFEIRRFTDAGAEIDAPVQINRQTGVVSFNRATTGAYVSQSNVTGSVTMDAQAGSHFVNFLTGNVTTSTLNNGANGMVITLAYVQDATGGRTVSWPSSCRFAGGVAPTDTTANTRTTVTFTYSGGQWREIARAVAVPN